MNHITGKELRIILLLAGLLIAASMTGTGIQFGYAQTNIRALQDRVAELEKKLADAKVRQEKAYSVQMKLEEQEQKLASLAESDKYKVQIIEIRADIKNIRTRIEAITKEKNDLEENLRLAKNLQTILGEAQTIVKPEAKIPANPVQEKKPAQTGLMATVKPEITATEAKGGWRIENIQLSNHFNDDERHEIMNTFGGSRQINQDDLLKGAYQIYSHVGISLRFLIHPKSGSVADLEILLGQREDNANSYFTFITPMTLGQFKSKYFSITVNK
ncbi:MAG: hypothetical protein WAV07_15940 [Candidatus Contendobacter sp.]